MVPGDDSMIPGMIPGSGMNWWRSCGIVGGCSSAVSSLLRGWLAAEEQQVAMIQFAVAMSVLNEPKLPLQKEHSSAGRG